MRSRFDGQFHCGNDAAQIRRDGLKAQQNIDSVLIDLFLQMVDLFVIGDCICAKIVVAIEQALHRSLQTALSQARHHEHVVA